MRRESRSILVAGGWVAATAAVAFGGVSACGRLGYDLQPLPDASIDGEVRGDGGSPANDAQAGPDAREDGNADDASGDGAAACSATCTNAHGTTACAGDTCVPTCSTGFADCDGDPTNGCEANVEGDPAHCGGCTGVCVADGGSAICQNGVCGTSSCPAGTGDCDPDAGASCATNLNTSPQNCRFCGNACTYANASGVCTGGVCSLGTCASGFGDCDGLAATGCETDLSSTTDHCGTCATACTNSNGTTSCVGSVCTPVCSPNFDDCDGDVVNGCETSLETVSNCGHCGNACTSDGGTASCSGGACTTTCDFGGTWAAKITVQVTWPAVNPTLAGGSGVFTFWARMSGTQSGSTIPATLALCGITVPDFQSSALAGNEPYGLVFPSGIFDPSPLVPTVGDTVTLGGSSPGSTFTAPTLAFLVGLTLNPATAMWPPATSLVPTDPDGDGKVGVTATYKTGGSYRDVPIDSNLPVGTDGRAADAYLAARLVGSFSGTLTDCSHGTGSASVSNIDTRILGCDLAGDAGGTCTAGEATYDDTNKPVYVLGSGTVTLVKVASGATCAAVRSAAP